jgi:hypothetical protein
LKLDALFGGLLEEPFLGTRFSGGLVQKGFQGGGLIMVVLKMRRGVFHGRFSWSVFESSSDRVDEEGVFWGRLKITGPFFFFLGV